LIAAVALLSVTAHPAAAASYDELLVQAIVAVRLVDLRLQNSPHVQGLNTDDRHNASGSLAGLTSRIILPASSTMQTLVSLTDTSSPAKCSMLRFSF